MTTPLWLKTTSRFFALKYQTIYQFQNMIIAAFYIYLTTFHHSHIIIVCINKYCVICNIVDNY